MIVPRIEIDKDDMEDQLKKLHCHKKTILVVDDDEITRRMLVKILERKGFRTAEAATGGEVFKKTEQELINLVLLDIKLPDIDGIQLLSKLKERHPDLAAIMITGHASLENAVEALNRGATAYITKPVDVDEVLAKIGEAILKQTLVMENRQLTRAFKKEIKARKKTEKELIRQKEELEKVNSALRVLLRKTEQDREELERNFLSNIKEIIKPGLDRLRRTSLNPRQSFYLETIEQSVDGIVSPLIRQLSSSYVDLTPMEIQVANLIRNGSQTKEIADMFNLSENTILSHRFKIRRKLGLLNKKTNLQSYLRTLE